LFKKNKRIFFGILVLFGAGLSLQVLYNMIQNTAKENIELDEHGFSRLFKDRIFRNTKSPQKSFVCC
jgi:hypothetical protein